MQTPRNDHWNAIIYILRYLKNDLRQGLLYEDKGNTQISYCSNGDWVGYPERRSTIGCYIFLVGNIISWKNKKQNAVLINY